MIMGQIKSPAKLLQRAGSNDMNRCHRVFANGSSYLTPNLLQYQPTTSIHSATQPSALMQARAMGGDRPPWPAFDTGNQVASGQA